jgi:hypothetical protein
MPEPLREITDAAGWSAERFRKEIVEECRPVVLRGLVANWPLVRAASPKALKDYVLKFDRGGTMEAFFGARSIAGKYYYADELKGFNFERRAMRFADALDLMVAGLDKPDSESVYVGSIHIDDFLPGLSAENAMPLLPANAAPRIWLGHASNVSCHYDAFENLACVIAGKRHFTLYPPELIGDLYVGPIDNTMAGQPVSLAASSPRDDAKYPRFAAVRDQALVAELQAGDALFLPKLWWHQVEGTAPFNGLINYWWDAFAGGPDAPYTSLLLSMITIAERPLQERLAWRAWFDHYVFQPDRHPLEHLPAEKRGILGPLKPENYGRIRAWVMHLLRGG